MQHAEIASGKALECHTADTVCQAGPCCRMLVHLFVSRQQVHVADPQRQQHGCAGTKVYIFSSGSRQAQSDMFGHTSQGDVRHLLSGYFDTSSGAKVRCWCCSTRAACHPRLFDCELELVTPIVLTLASDWVVMHLRPLPVVLLENSGRLLTARSEAQTYLAHMLPARIITVL